VFRNRGDEAWGAAGGEGTPLAGSKIYIGGTASTYKDIDEMAHYDLIIAGIASLSLILLIMLFITRSLVAALVIVGTVALSLGASVGISVWCGSTWWVSSCIG
jgi:RND superfamily putative drug exporter